MENKEEEKIHKKSKVEEKIYIQEEEEVEEIDEEEGEIEEVDELDSQFKIQILDDSIEKKKLKKVKKESESEEYYSEDTPKDKNNSSQNDKENETDNDNSNALKRKRRRRKEFTGPGYKCPDCGKSYFSMPALNTHRKSKHDLYRKGGGRGRGRPRKDPLIIHPEATAPQIHEINKNQENIISYSKIESKISHFFDEENRKPVYGEIINKNIVTDIINNYKKNFHNIVSFTDNKLFYQKILEEWGDKKINENGNNNENMTFINLTNYKSPKGNEYINISEINILDGKEKDENKKRTFDQAITRYLKECSNLTNINFFKTIFFIIILFRDGINNYFNEINLNKNNSLISLYEDTKNNYETIYTNNSKYNDEIPGLINNVISKYFEPNSFFAIKQKDVQDVILHFFHWLYTFSYTNKKVTHA